MFQGTQKEWRRLLQKHLDLFDPEDFSDSIIGDIAWSPLNDDGESPESDDQMKQSGERLSFQVRPANLFYALLLLILLLGTATALLLAIGSGGGMRWLIAIVAASPVAGYGIYGFIHSIIAIDPPIVFNQKENYYRNPSDCDQFDGEQIDTPLDEIIGVQYLTKVSSDEGRYGTEYFYCYELNLILKNGNRIHFKNFSNIEKLQEYGSTITAFLSIPLLDGVIETPCEAEVSKLMEEIQEI